MSFRFAAGERCHALPQNRRKIRSSMLNVSHPFSPRHTVFPWCCELPLQHCYCQYNIRNYLTTALGPIHGGLASKALSYTYHLTRGINAAFLVWASLFDKHGRLISTVLSPSYWLLPWPSCDIDPAESLPRLRHQKIETSWEWWMRTIISGKRANNGRAYHQLSLTF